MKGKNFTKDTEAEDDGVHKDENDADAKTIKYVLALRLIHHCIAA